MSLFTRTIIRCAVCPSDVESTFKTVFGGAPKFFKQSEVEFQFAFFTDPSFTTLLDISNVSYANLRLRSVNASGTLLMDGDSAGAEKALHAALSLPEWQAGTSQHVRIFFPSSLTNITAGTHFLTLYGLTSESSGNDVFGRCNCEVVDVGDLGASATPAPGTTPASIEQVQALLQQTLADYARKIGEVGDTLTVRGTDGTAIVLRAANGQMFFDVQES